MPLRRGRMVAAAAPAAEGGEREHARQLESERRRAHAGSARRRPHELTRPRPHVACAAPLKRSSHRTTATTPWLCGRGAQRGLCSARAARPDAPLGRTATWRGRNSTIRRAGPRASCWRRWRSARELFCRWSATRATFATCAPGCNMCALRPRCRTRRAHAPPNTRRRTAATSQRRFLTSWRCAQPETSSWRADLCSRSTPAPLAAPRHRAGLCAVLRSACSFPRAARRLSAGPRRVRERHQAVRATSASCVSAP